MKYAGMLGAAMIGASIATGAGGALKPRQPPSTNPCTLNEGECYSIQGRSPSADQCVPPLVAYYVQVEQSNMFLECLRGHGDD